MPSYRAALGPPPPLTRYGLLLSLITRYPGQLTSFYSDKVGESTHILSAMLCAMKRDGHVRNEIERKTARWFPMRDVGPIDIDVTRPEQVDRLRKLYAESSTLAVKDKFKRTDLPERSLNRLSLKRVRDLEARFTKLEDELVTLRNAKREFDVAMQVIERDFPNVRRERLRLSLENA